MPRAVGACCVRLWAVPWCRQDGPKAEGPLVTLQSSIPSGSVELSKCVGRSLRQVGARNEGGGGDALRLGPTGNTLIPRCRAAQVLAFKPHPENWGKAFASTSLPHHGLSSVAALADTCPGPALVCSLENTSSVLRPLWLITV